MSDPLGTLDKLQALEDLRRLKARYFRLLDTKQWDAWSEIFEPDIVAEFPDDHPDAVYRGRDVLVSTVRASLDPALTLHHGHTPELDVLAPASAKGIWAMQDWLYWPEGGNQVGLSGVRSLLGWGHYHETYVKRAGEWRIATLKLTRMHRVIT
jgi:hypothetical protein